MRITRLDPMNLFLSFIYKYTIVKFCQQYNFKILIKSALQMAAENRFLPPDKIKILETIEPNVREFEITREFESDRELEPESSETIESSEITESEKTPQGKLAENNI